MSHKSRHGKRHRHDRHRHGGKHPAKPGNAPGTVVEVVGASGNGHGHGHLDEGVLEVVLVSDTVGTLDAVRAAVSKIAVEGVELHVIHGAVGEVSRSDLQMAATGGRLVVGFNVGLGPHLDRDARELGVEVRLFEVIYRLTDELEALAQTLKPPEVEEKVLGGGDVIKLFKSSEGDIIAGCEIKKGRFAVGDRYRIVGAMGPLHEGKVESLHVGPDTVSEARAGSQAGLKIFGFTEVKVGDLVECFTRNEKGGRPRWRPRPGIFRAE